MVGKLALGTAFFTSGGIGISCSRHMAFRQRHAPRVEAERSVPARRRFRKTLSPMGPLGVSCHHQTIPCPEPDFGDRPASGSLGSARSIDGQRHRPGVQREPRPGGSGGRTPGPDACAGCQETSGGGCRRSASFWRMVCRQRGLPDKPDAGTGKRQRKWAAAGTAASDGSLPC